MTNILQRTLDKLVAWENKWEMKFNVNKCEMMHIGKRNLEYQMSDGWVKSIDEERERFCNDLNGVVDRIGNGYRLCAIGDLNGWLEDRSRVGVTGGFGVPGENDNGRMIIDLFVKRVLYVSNNYFEHKSLREWR